MLPPNRADDYCICGVAAYGVELSHELALVGLNDVQGYFPSLHHLSSLFPQIPSSLLKSLENTGAHYLAIHQWSRHFDLAVYDNYAAVCFCQPTGLSIVAVFTILRFGLCPRRNGPRGRVKTAIFCLIER